MVQNNEVSFPFYLSKLLCQILGRLSIKREPFVVLCCFTVCSCGGSGASLFEANFKDDSTKVGYSNSSDRNALDEDPDSSQGGFGNRKAVDILFIVNTSYSMIPHLKRIGESFSGFINNLGNSSWRIGITNADVDPNATHYVNNHLFFGRLIPFEFMGEILPYTVLTSDNQKADTIFLQTLKRNSPTDAVLPTSLLNINPCYAPPYCQGQVSNPIHSLIKSFAANPDFFRHAADLAVIIFTNGDETDFYDSIFQKLKTEFKNNFPSQKNLKVYGIFVIPGDNNCLLAQNHAIRYDFSLSTYGENIYRLVQATQGGALSICSINYSKLAKTIVHSL